MAAANPCSWENLGYSNTHNRTSESGNKWLSQIAHLPNFEMNHENSRILSLTNRLDAIKGGVNPVTLSEHEFFVLFTILNVNVYISITDINHLP